MLYSMLLPKLNWNHKQHCFHSPGPQFCSTADPLPTEITTESNFTWSNFTDRQFHDAPLANCHYPVHVHISQRFGESWIKLWLTHFLKAHTSTSFWKVSSANHLRRQDGQMAVGMTEIPTDTSLLGPTQVSEPLVLLQWDKGIAADWPLISGTWKIHSAAKYMQQKLHRTAFQPLDEGNKQ